MRFIALWSIVSALALFGCQRKTAQNATPKGFSDYTSGNPREYAEMTACTFLASGWQTPSRSRLLAVISGVPEDDLVPLWQCAANIESQFNTQRHNYYVGMLQFDPGTAAQCDKLDKQIIPNLQNSPYYNALCARYVLEQSRAPSQWGGWSSCVNSHFPKGITCQGKDFPSNGNKLKEHCKAEFAGQPAPHDGGNSYKILVRTRAECAIPGVNHSFQIVAKAQNGNKTTLALTGKIVLGQEYAGDIKKTNYLFPTIAEMKLLKARATKEPSNRIKTDDYTVFGVLVTTQDLAALQTEGPLQLHLFSYNKHNQLMSQDSVSFAPRYEAPAAPPPQPPAVPTEELAPMPTPIFKLDY